MSIAESFFVRSGKTEQEIQEMANKLMNADEEVKKADIFNYGQKINRALGMMPAKKEDYSPERSLLEEEMISFHKAGMFWGMTPQFTFDELVEWLKKYFAYMAYIEHFQLETEAMRNGLKTPEKNKKPQH